jgi:hypothetical protein
MQEALINQFLQSQNKTRDNYIKKVKSMVDGLLFDEYNLLVKGIQPKVKKEKKSWEKE